MVEGQLFFWAGAGSSKKKTRASKKQTGSATLVRSPKKRGRGPNPVKNKALTPAKLLAHEELLPTGVEPVGSRGICHCGGASCCTAASAISVMILVISAEGCPIVVSKAIAVKKSFICLKKFTYMVCFFLQYLQCIGLAWRNGNSANGELIEAGRGSNFECGIGEHICTSCIAQHHLEPHKIFFLKFE